MKTLISNIKANTTPWVILFTLAMLFFTIFRFLFMILHIDLISDSSILNILRAFGLGLLFDWKILCLIILPQFLIVFLFKIDLSKNITSRIFIWTNIILFAFIFLLSTVDLRYIDHFGARLNYWAVAYIEFPWLVIYSLFVSGDFYILLLVWLPLFTLFVLIGRYFLRRYSKKRSEKSKKPKTALFFSILLIGFAGILSGFPGWSNAFLTNNHFVNRLSFNCLYTLGRSIYKTSYDKNIIPDFYPIEYCFSTTQKMLGLQLNDSLSLKYTTGYNDRLEFRPNIITIIMEGWTAESVGALGAKHNVSPVFDSLCKNGILFTDFYANGIRTNRGIPATLCSFPSLPGHSIMQNGRTPFPFISLADILSRYNYESIFAYGGDIEFDNVKNFLTNVGYSRFYGQEELQEDEQLSQWGIADHKMFDKLTEEIKSFSRPFNLSIMTLSNHEPFEVPDDRFVLNKEKSLEAKKLNTFYYTDWAIGQFINSLKQQSLFDSTIFVFTADHCPHQSAEYPIDPKMFRIPLLIYAPNIIGDSAIRIDKTASQVDITPTIINILNLNTELYCWGRNILSLPDSDSGFAIINAEEKLGLIEGSMLYLHWLEATREMYDITDPSYLKKNLISQRPETASDMERRLNSYIQLADYLSKK